jgi:WD40 repeat protein
VGYVFISYSHLDRDIVERLVEQLRKDGTDVWFDRSLVHGEHFPERIEKEIANSAVVVPVMSPRSATSSWVKKECDLARKSQRLVMPISLEQHIFKPRYEKLHVEMVGEDPVLSESFVGNIREACRPSVRYVAKSALKGHYGAVRSVAVSPITDLLASAGDDHTVRIWDLASAKERAIVQDGMKPTWPVAFTPDGSRVAAPSSVQDGVHLWDANSATLVRKLGHHDEVVSFAFSPDGKLLATGGGVSSTQVWDATNGVLRQGLTAGTMRPAWPLCFSPDNALLAVANHGSNSVSLWNTSSLERVHRTDLKGARVTAVCFDPSSQIVLSGQSDGGLELDTVDGYSLRDLHPHTGQITAIACSTRDKVFATAGVDGLVKVTSLITGEELQVLNGHAGEVCGLAFSRDDGQLATAGLDGTIRLWHRT